MKIYSYYKDKQTGDNLISILEKDKIFTAITFTQSKDFKTLKGAKNWLEKRGYTKIIDMETFN